jgi:hypothetical protein
MAQVVEHLLRKCEALSSIFCTTKKQKVRKRSCAILEIGYLAYLREWCVDNCLGEGGTAWQPGWSSTLQVCES